MSAPKVCKAALQAALGRPVAGNAPQGTGARRSRFSPQAEPEGTAEAPKGMHGFLKDVRSMCQLIDEAGRYGATDSMEREYRALRSRLAQGYRGLQDELGRLPIGGPGFHGCNFELLFANYSLDLLVRGPGQRSVEMLTEIWRARQTADGEAV